jgi:hypothetical protein
MKLLEVIKRIGKHIEDNWFANYHNFFLEDGNYVTHNLVDIDGLKFINNHFPPSLLKYTLEDLRNWYGKYGDIDTNVKDIKIKNEKLVLITH